MVSTVEVGTDDDDLDAVWKALGNRTRRKILDLLVEGPSSTRQLADAFDELSRFAVMQHLAVLRDADLVIGIKQGRNRMNHLNPIPIQQIGDRWISRYQRPLAEALVDLKLSLEVEASGLRADTQTHQPTQESPSRPGAIS